MCSPLKAAGSGDHVGSHINTEFPGDLSPECCLLPAHMVLLRGWFFRALFELLTHRRLQFVKQSDFLSS